MGNALTIGLVVNPKANAGRDQGVRLRQFREALAEDGHAVRMMETAYANVHRGAYRMSEQGWPAQEIVKQVGLSRTVGSGPSGHAFFRMANLVNNTKGVSSMLKKAGY